MSDLRDVRIEVLQTQRSLDAAHSLLAVRYIEMGYLAIDDGFDAVVDEWSEIATYFGARRASGELVGVARLIPYTELSLPVFRDLALDDAGREWLAAADTSRIAEFSALAVKPDVDTRGAVSRQLYRAMYQHCAVRSGHATWVAAIAVRVRRLIERSLDSQFKALGPAVWYRGAMTEPVVFDTTDQYIHYATRSPRWREWFCEGLTIDLTRGGPRFVAEEGHHLPTFEVAAPAELEALTDLDRLT